MKFSNKILILLIGMIFSISVGQSSAGPPKNASPFVSVHLDKQVLQVVPATNVMVTAIVIEKRAETSVQDNRQLYNSTVPEPVHVLPVFTAETFRYRDLSPHNFKSVIIPRCRSSDVV